MGGPTPLPPQMPTTLRSLFSNYTSVPTPNGKSIHIIAQRGVSPERLMRERLKLTLLVMRGEGIDPDALSDAGAILLLYAGEERPQSHWARVIRPEGGRSARVGAL